MKITEEQIRSALKFDKKLLNAHWLGKASVDDFASARWQHKVLLDKVAPLLAEMGNVINESGYFCQDVLARVNQAIATDCPKCDYQCQGCIKSVDDCEATKSKINATLAKLKALLTEGEE
ncbi:MAG: hypothetical protein H0X02_08320 [Nitrosomonas sp.]|nr:hypothetical protein [Nitrosomonas sp.]